MHKNPASTTPSAEKACASVCLKGAHACDVFCFRQAKALCTLEGLSGRLESCHLYILEMYKFSSTNIEGMSLTTPDTHL